MIWATRGYSWGFRFVRNGGFDDPLREYERSFSSASGSGEYFERASDRVVLRFLDPEGRKDRSGRPIPHEFVLFGTETSTVNSLEDGIREVWPLVAQEYERIWKVEGREVFGA
ncbi:hypothetical protein ACFSYH_04035 [Populibacterium corticicola]|uniref:Uncharacterized protein n=1 Tax=Populibacterium corticicola TaxID=1812826 RepID=A0ABW5XCC6_9MICO